MTKIEFYICCRIDCSNIQKGGRDPRPNQCSLFFSFFFSFKLILDQAQHLSQLKKLTEKENYSTQIQDLTQTIDMKRLQIDKIQSINSSLQERTLEYNVGTTMVDSRTAYALSLYSKISNISFDYRETNLPEGKLVGCKSLHFNFLQTFNLIVLSMFSQMLEMNLKKSSKSLI